MEFNDKYPSEMHDLNFCQPIARWDEALPLGNGLTGCLLWGDGAPLRFSLDRGDLWDTRPAPEILADDFTYRNLIDLVRRREQEEIACRFNDFFTLYPYPTKLPAGRLELDFGFPVKHMNCRLNIREAKAEVEWNAGEEACRAESFLHAETGLGYIKMRGTGAARPDLRLVPPAYSGSYEAPDDYRNSLEISLASLGYPEATFGVDGDVKWFHQKTNHSLEYAIVVAERKYSEHEIEWVYVIAANLDGTEWFKGAKERVREGIRIGFNGASQTHTAWWKRYWRQSSLTLSDFEMEKQWYLTNYLFGSCSRKYAPPMPLQGVWTADEGMLPPWKGDYHHDLNVQLCYWHYLKANHLTEGESLLDFLWELRPVASEFARTFYETPGINLPSVMTIDGKPLGGWPMYALSPTNQIWLSQAFDHYWKYTGDLQFLETRTYVYMKETAECIEQLLHPGDDGKLRLSLSSSPEIHNDTLDAWLTPNSNYDLSLLRYLFARLEQMADLLGKAAEREKWKDILSRLPELAINETGLKLSPDEALNETHRHLSHAMAIYPLQTLDYRHSESDKQVIDQTIAHLEKLGKGYYCGYTFAWIAAIYTRQGNGEAARYHLKTFWEYMCSPNGFHLNCDFKETGLTGMRGRVFTLEGNMAAADALQEMLLQTSDGLIRPFPSIPKEWFESGAEFRRFRGDMGILVSAKLAAGRLDFVELHAERGGVYRVENRFGSDSLTLEKNGEISTIECPIQSEIVIEIQKGETVLLRIKDEANALINQQAARHPGVN